MAKHLVIVKNNKNGRILDSFGMKQEGFAFFFQNSDGKWVNPAMTDGAMAVAFKMLLKDDDKFLWSSNIVFTKTKGKYTVEARELL